MQTRIFLAWLAILSVSTVLYNFDYILPEYRIYGEPKKYCVRMRDGKLIVTNNGNVLVSDVTLPDGTVVMTNGVVLKKDGKKILLNNGECIDENGEITEEHPERDKNSKTMENKTYSLPDKKDMKTLSSCLNSLAVSGYETQFKATAKGLRSLSTEKTFQPEEVRIAHYYRFEGESDPSDNAIVYAIETEDGEKGTLVDAFGPYSDSNVTHFIHEVEEIHK